MPLGALIPHPYNRAIMTDIAAHMEVNRRIIMHHIHIHRVREDCQDIAANKKKKGEKNKHRKRKKTRVRFCLNAYY